MRNEVTIGTKIWLRMLGSPKLEDAEIKTKFRQAVEESLRRLQMDHVDILYNHGLDTAAATTRDEPLKPLQALKKEGKTRIAGSRRIWGRRRFWTRRWCRASRCGAGEFQLYDGEQYCSVSNQRRIEVRHGTGCDERRR